MRLLTSTIAADMIGDHCQSEAVWAIAEHALVVGPHMGVRQQNFAPVYLHLLVLLLHGHAGFRFALYAVQHCTVLLMAACCLAVSAASPGCAVCWMLPVPLLMAINVAIQASPLSDYTACPCSRVIAALC